MDGYSHQDGYDCGGCLFRQRAALIGVSSQRRDVDIADREVACFSSDVRLVAGCCMVWLTCIFFYSLCFSLVGVCACVFSSSIQDQVSFWYRLKAHISAGESHVGKFGGSIIEL